MALTIPVAEIVESSKNPLLAKHETWGRVLLGDIATIQNGFPFKSSQFTRDEGVPLIRIRDVGEDSSDTNYVGEYDPAFIVKAGDLLIGMDGDFNCARWRGPDGLLNQRVCRVILKSDIYHPKLLDYALPGYLKAINDMTSSVTVKHLSSKSIAEIPLPLPPMDQQKRIVAEIEKQFSRLDEAVANLKRVKANLKRYKAAVLKAAVEGRLVETEAEFARREGRSYETGAQLLQRILETRRSQWQGKGKYKEPAAPDTTDLPELPEGWVWTDCDALIDRIEAGASFKCIERPPVGYETGVLKVSAVTWGIFNEQESKTCNDPDRIEDRYLVQEGDFLFSRANTIDLVGACVIVRHVSKRLMLSDKTLRLKISSLVSEEWLLICLRSEWGRLEIERLATGNQESMRNIGQDRIRKIRIPLPPLSEQIRAASETERRFSLCEATQIQVVQNLNRANALRTSILNTTFNKS